MCTFSRAKKKPSTRLDDRDTHTQSLSIKIEIQKCRGLEEHSSRRPGQEQTHNSTRVLVFYSHFSHFFFYHVGVPKY